MFLFSFLHFLRLWAELMINGHLASSLCIRDVFILFIMHLLHRHFIHTVSILYTFACNMYLVNYVFSDSVCIHCVFITHSCSFHRVFMLYTCCILIYAHCRSRCRAFAQLIVGFVIVVLPVNQLYILPASASRRITFAKDILYNIIVVFLKYRCLVL